MATGNKVAVSLILTKRSIHDVIAYIPNPATQPRIWKIALPESLSIKQAVMWPISFKTAGYPSIQKQTNAICERPHLTWEISYATRCAVNQTMQTSPGALVFQRDMLFDIPVVTDLDAVRNKRQLQINNNLIWSNKRWIHYNYQPGKILPI